MAVTSGRSDPLTLDIRLTLRGQRPVEVAQFFLPWDNPRSLVLLAGWLPEGVPIAPANPGIGDPGPASVVLQPGHMVAGTIDLRTRFPSLAKILVDRDVIIFWTYELYGMAGTREWSSGRMAGWVFLKRRPPVTNDKR